MCVLCSEANGAIVLMVLLVHTRVEQFRVHQTMRPVEQTAVHRQCKEQLRPYSHTRRRLRNPHAKEGAAFTRTGTRTLAHREM